jgi:predicted metal-binding membrane protein
MMRRASLVSLLIAGYLCVWALFGVAVFFADAVLHEIFEATPGLSERADLIPPSLLLAAGLFQFSPLKYACLEQCRSPLGFLIQRWRGGRRALRAFTVGLEHGSILRRLLLGVDAADVRGRRHPPRLDARAWCHYVH